MTKEQITKRLTQIAYAFATVFYITIGIVAFIFAKPENGGNIDFLATLILLSSVPHLLIYVIDRKKQTYLIIGLVGIVFGVLFLATDVFDPDSICMVWGAIDICRGTTEIISVAPHVKKNKAELIEIAISLGDIAIGILLIIHMSNGIVLHLIYLGIEFLISGTKNIVDYFVEKKRYAKRPDNN